MGEKTRSSYNICCEEGGMKGSCWVYLSIADIFPSIFWKSPVELCQTQMCPLCWEDDGGTRQIRNRLQEARKFDENVTWFMKSANFLQWLAADVCVEEEDGGVVSSDISWRELVEQQHNYVQSWDVISSSQVNYNNVHYMSTNGLLNHGSWTTLQMNDWVTSNSEMKDFLLIRIQRKLIMRHHWSVKNHYRNLEVMGVRTNPRP